MSGADSQNLLQIAKVLKSNGTDGGLLLGFRDLSPEDIDLSEPVFIEFDGLPVPFFIESFARKGTSRAIAHLTGIRSLEGAEEVVGRAVYAQEDTLAVEDGDEWSLEDFVGWTVADADGHSIGEVTGVEDIPGNPCLYLRLPAIDSLKEILIPMHPDLVLEIDEEASVIRMEIPAGLL